MAAPVILSKVIQLAKFVIVPKPGINLDLENDGPCFGSEGKGGQGSIFSSIMTSSSYTGHSEYTIVVKLKNDIDLLNNMTKACEETDTLLSLTLRSVITGADYIEITFGCTADIEYMRSVQHELNNLPGIKELSVRPNTGSIDSFYYRK